MSDQNAPQIVVTSVTPSECGLNSGAIDVTIIGGTDPITYTWSNNENTEDVSALNDGTYDLMVEDFNNCKSYASIIIEDAAPASPEICVVTVDTNIYANLIVWDKTAFAGFDHFNVYKESSQSDVYLPLASVPMDSLSEVVDSVANPMIKAYKYKISAVDACGNESEMSPSHKTIHLNINKGLGNNLNLIWDHYEGFAFGTYHIWRYEPIGGWVNVDDVTSTTTSWTDINVVGNQDDYFYFLEVTPPSQCTSTRAKNYNASRSNTASLKLSGGVGVKKDAPAKYPVSVIYPNPSAGVFYIMVGSVEEEVTLTVTNTLGQIVKTQKGNTAVRQTIDIRDAALGTYFVEISTPSNGKTVKKVVKN